MSKTRNNMPVTEERKQLFLRAYVESYGNFSQACRVASPHSKDTVNPPCRSTFLHLLNTDPSFKAALAEADLEIKDNILEIVKKRAVEGTKKYIYQKAQQVRNDDGTLATETVYDNRLLMRWAQKLDPDWFEKHVHEHSGAVEHRLVTSAELLRMTPEERRTVEKALDIIGEKEHTAGALEYQPGEVLEAEFEEVEEDAIMVYERNANATN